MDEIASITDTNLTETQFYNRVYEINMLSIYWVALNSIHHQLYC